MDLRRKTEGILIIFRTLKFLGPTNLHRGYGLSPLWFQGLDIPEYHKVYNSCPLSFWQNQNQLFWYDHHYQWEGSQVLNLYKRFVDYEDTIKLMLSLQYRTVPHHLGSTFLSLAVWKFHLLGRNRKRDTDCYHPKSFQLSLL